MNPYALIAGLLTAILYVLMRQLLALGRIDESLRAILEPAEPRRCRVCGCMDDVGCPEGCWWVEEDLCSMCAEPLRVHVYDDDGEVVPR